MKSSLPKKHGFSERPKSVSSSRHISRDASPGRKLNNSRISNSNYNSNQANSPSGRSFRSSNQNPGTPNSHMSSFAGINMSELTFNVNDDHKTLINKNRKLSNLLIQASNKMVEMNDKIIHNESRFKKEKEDMVKKLDRITVNYKVYAESHQNLIKFKADYDNLRKDYDHNYKILSYYEDLIKHTLSNLIQTYKKVSEFLVDYSREESSTNFLVKLREKQKGELKNCLQKIDGYNFREIYTQIKIINDEMEHYDAEIYKPKFPQPNMEQSKPQPSRENYEKVLNPVVKQTNGIQKHNDISYQNTVSSKSASPHKDPNSNTVFTNSEANQNQNEMESLGGKVNENIKQLYDTLYKNTGKVERKPSSNTTNKNNQESNSLKNTLKKKESFGAEMDKKESSDPYREDSDKKMKIWVTAIYDFAPKSKKELGFKKGDVMLIEEVQDTGWWLANKDGRVGMIPFNYIRINDD